ncbi:ATPase, P-type (transporting), HAD superfamily, subfamily IC [Methanococcus maripaludis C5]|uniref:ATPase, P-type (Transporting), HAD superfamily, subfamily IC n=1 Tax=Methanococcus maripaludis (strain C5 / ATCC BAA-1333) TaxID=402880 RepID=A4FYV6_METM5|nr:HAD-IC family P-type ATPase [Methanococcus maripaludis]ABO35390.1 ATPase, P-type (transporting), HAD superfamily, subfamily IC [Methanococcus maripaludis C5]
MTFFKGFKEDYFGLTDLEVKKYQETYGKNELLQKKKKTFLSRVLKIFSEPMFVLLFITAFVYFFLGEPRDGSIMVISVVFICTIEFFQEWRTDKTLQALKDLSSPQSTVIRNGKIMTIDSEELTVDDLFMLKEGEKIAADGIIIENYGLGVNESTLTGESDVVWKKIDLDKDESSEHWKKNICYTGTSVTQGRAVVKVINIGSETEYGKIGKDIFSVDSILTPLEKQTRELVTYSAIAAFFMLLLIVFVNFYHMGSITDSILSGVTVAMAIIPEEFPVILTVFLAMGAWRLANKNSLIRRIPAVETLGSISVLCVDKTGTLTKNQMEVKETHFDSKFNETELMTFACLSSETEAYDPMEKAILTYSKSIGINIDELFNGCLLHEYPFSSETQMMGNVWDKEDKKFIVSKGSFENIINLCELNESEKVNLEKKSIVMAKKGYRVIAVARKMDVTNINQQLYEYKLEFVGLIGLMDPPREGVSKAMKICNDAGIRVVMLTGDNGTTAKSIAKTIGIKNSENVLTGHEIDSMSDNELLKKIKITNIFSRVIPKHKLKIIKAFKELGEIVAMTGDGVNDAPALKYADIGISMGKRGTEVAKEASDMILLDDNFETIVETIHDGRRIYDNIKKAIGYVFVIHIPVFLTALFAPLLKLPLLLLPINVVLMEFIIDPTCSIVFERQPVEKGIMLRKPRMPNEPLLDYNLIFKAVIQGISIFTATFGSYAYLLHQGCKTDLARTFAFIILIAANFFLVYVNQSEIESVFSAFKKFKNDMVLWLVNIGIFGGILIILYIPSATVIAKTVPLTEKQLLAALLLSGASTLWWEVIKLLKRIKMKK